MTAPLPERWGPHEQLGGHLPPLPYDNQQVVPYQPQPSQQPQFIVQQQPLVVQHQPIIVQPQVPGNFYPPHIQPKDTAAAYLFAVFLGHLGIHNFYLGRTGAGLGQLLLWLGGVSLAVFGIGTLLLLAVLIWWIVDLCCIPGYIRYEHQQRLREAHQMQYRGY